MKKILVIGGSGYVGKVLVKDLLKQNYEVINVDFEIYSDQKNNSNINNNQTKNFIHLDFRNTEEVKQYLKNIDCVVILGGLVGEYITKKYSTLSQAINEDGLFNLIDLLNQFENIKKIIFISTCSNYGITDNNILVDEEHKLNPISPYAKAKVKIENYLFSKKNTNYSPTILRFATAFGYSPRMRFDLTLNHFCYSMLKEKEIEVFDADTWRPYCHVKDFSSLIIKVISAKSELTNREIYNVGSDENNYTKRGIIELVKSYLPETKVIFKKKGSDKRDYRVSFKKVNTILDFKPEYSVEDGIKEVLDVLQAPNCDYLKEDSLKIRGNFNILNHVK